MFPIRKRRYTTKSTLPAKVPKLTINMPAMRRKTTFRRKSQYKRRTTSGPNGKFFKPNPNINSYKIAKWMYQVIELPLPQATDTAVDLTTIRTQLNAQLGYTPISLKIHNLKSYNSWGSGTTEGTPALTVKGNSLNSAGTLGKMDDRGLVSDPARVGYKWPYLEANHMFDLTTNVTIAQIGPATGKDAVVQVGVSFLSTGN